MSRRACMDFCAAAQNSLSDRSPTFGISRSITNLGIVHLPSVCRASRLGSPQERNFIPDMVGSQSSILVGGTRRAAKFNFCDYNSGGGGTPCPSPFLFPI